MLDRNIVVLELLGLVLRLRQESIQPAADACLVRAASRSAYAGKPLQLAMNSQFQCVDGDVRLLEDGWRQTLLLIEQCQENVLDIHLRMLQSSRHPLSPGQGLLCFFGETIDIHRLVPLCTAARVSERALRSESNAM